MDKLNELESVHKPLKNEGSKENNHKSEFMAKIDSIYTDSNLEPQTKVDQLYKFYVETVLEELREAHKHLAKL